MARRGRGRRKAVRALMAAKADSGDAPSETPEGKANAESAKVTVDAPKDDSSETVVIPTENESFESAKTIIDSPMAEPGESAETKVDSPAPKVKSKARKRTPLPKGRSSKKRRAGGDGEGKRGRTRAVRPKSSPAPFIIAGGFVLVAVVVAAIVVSDNKKTRSRAGATSGSDASSASTKPSEGSQTPAPAASRGGSAYVKIRFDLNGLTPRGDERHMTAAFGRCGTQLTSRVDTCPNCGAKLRWPKDNKVRCKFCCPRSRLKVDDLDQISEDRRDGFCAYCKGTGKDPNFRPEMRRGLFGLDKTRPGGDAAPSGAGKCPVCKGTGKCTRCHGTGWVEIPNTFKK